LKHFYSIFDFEQELISLGVNTHSKDLVKMYPVGDKPQTVKNETSTNEAYLSAASSE
jgi:hypothetical protein